MGETNDQQKDPEDRDTRREQPAGLGLVASLCVLAGVFYFINSACSSSSSDGGGGFIGGSTTCPVARTPIGASIRFVAPRDGTTVTAPLSPSGTVQVPVSLAVSGLIVEASPRCSIGGGHFEIVVEPEGSHVTIPGPATSTILDLTPGEHRVTALFVNAKDEQLLPPLAPTVSITVRAE